MNTLRETNYFALDLELNTDGNQTYEICEIGISIGNVNNIILTDSKVIKIKQKLFDKTTEITGITQDEIDTGISLEESAQWISDLIETHKPFCNPITWGLGDAEELKNEYRQNGIYFPHFGRRVVDVKHFFLFIEASNGRSLSGGLRASMIKHKIKFIGTPHRAGNDSMNTLRFFFHLLKRQNILENIQKTSKLIYY
jgi:inhibitor of KinA sporulation pathway (predicted exonuclease)